MQKNHLKILVLTIFLTFFNQAISQELKQPKMSIVYKISKIKKDNPDKIKEILGKGNNINLTLSQGYTLLMWAVNNQYTHIVEYLINNNVNINKQDYKGNSALLYASNNNNNKVFNMLIKNGADIHLKNNGGQSPLINVVVKSDTEKLKTIILQKNKEQLALNKTYFEQ